MVWRVDLETTVHEPIKWGLTREVLYFYGEFETGPGRTRAVQCSRFNSSK
jgi:hypothetical protein